MSRHAFVSLLLAAALLFFCHPQALARNKVRDTNFAWRTLQTEHFRIQFYGDDVELRAFEVAGRLERAYTRITRKLDTRIRRRIPVFLYRSHNDFEQTNLYPGSLEWVEGFAEAVRDRIVLYLNPSERSLQHLIEHELTHVITYSVFFRRRVPSIEVLKLWIIPEWFVEGIAQHESPFRDSLTDMYIRDAVLDARLRPLNQLRSFSHLNPHEILEAYDQGGYFLDFLEHSLGEGSVAKLLHLYGRTWPWRTTTNFAAALGRDFFEVEREFRAALAKRYTEQAAGKGDPGGRAVPLTSPAGHYRRYCRSPCWSPDGKRIAYLNDEEEQYGIYLMSADGSRQRSLLRRALNRTIERVLSGSTALTWSPDGRKLCFAGEWCNDNFLYLVDVTWPHRLKKMSLPIDEARSPAFDSTGRRIAFSGIRAGVSDIYVYHVESGKCEQITSDRFDDDSPSWHPNGSLIAYSSERNAQRDLFAVELATRRITALTDTLSMESQPAWSPDGRMIAFSSDRGGIYNLYVLETAGGKVRRLTDVRGGAFSPTWSPERDQIAFAYYSHGCMNIHRLAVSAATTDYEPLPKEEQRAHEYERFSGEPVEEYTICEFENRMGTEFLLPLILFNQADFGDLTNDHKISAALYPIFWESGSLFTGDITYWNLSHRPDLAASVYSMGEVGADEEEYTHGVQLFSEYPFNEFRSFSVGYDCNLKETFVDDEYDTGTRQSDLFARFEHDSVIGRGLDATGGTYLSTGISWYDKALGSETEYTDWFINCSRHFSLTRDQIVAFKARGDWSNGTDAQEMDLAFGVRGLEPNRFEGTRRFAATIEYRFPIFRDVNVPVVGEFLLLKDLRGYLFADAGFTTGRPMENLLSDFDDPEWHDSFGVGLRLDFYLLQAAPFQLIAELMKTDTEDALVLMLGLRLFFLQ